MTERFKKPTDQQMFEFALLFNEGKIEREKLADMIGMCQMLIDRLYDNGDIMIPCDKEKRVQEGDDHLKNLFDKPQ